MKSYLIIIFFVLTVVTAGKSQTNGQPEDPKEVTRTILHLDSLFWHAYNVCDVEKMADFFIDDLEFYHDKGGLTLGKAAFVQSVKKGMCGNANLCLRREAIAGTVNIFPMNNTGALITGEHVFYIHETGKNEYIDGYGKFMQLWTYKNNEWKMTRVFSYDHGPAPYINKRKEVQVTASVLKKYAGEYMSPQVGVLTVVPDGNTLRLDAGKVKSVVFPESEKLFFTKERDLQFEFVTENNRAVKIIVHEKGNKVEEAKRMR